MSRFLVAMFVGATIAAAVSTSASAYHCLARAPNGASGTAFGVILERAVNLNAPVHTPRRWGWLPNRMVPAVLRFSAESGQVLKSLDTRKEEIGAAFYGRESGQALYLSSDWPLRNSYVVAAVLSTDHRIAFVS